MLKQECPRETFPVERNMCICNIIPWLYIFRQKAYQSTFITFEDVEKGDKFELILLAEYWTNQPETNASNNGREWIF